jgi:hypothetical protein
MTSEDIYAGALRLIGQPVSVGFTPKKRSITSVSIPKFRDGLLLKLNERSLILIDSIDGSRSRIILDEIFDIRKMI